MYFSTNTRLGDRNQEEEWTDASRAQQRMRGLRCGHVSNAEEDRPARAAFEKNSIIVRKRGNLKSPKKTRSWQLADSVWNTITYEKESDSIKGYTSMVSPHAEHGVRLPRDFG